MTRRECSRSSNERPGRGMGPSGPLWRRLRCTLPVARRGACRGCSLADDALCSLVDGANSLYLQLDEEEADTSSVMGVVDMLYDELTRRIDASAEIQLVSPLLRALYDAIYGRDIDTQGGDI